MGNRAGALDCLHDLARQRHGDAALPYLETFNTDEMEGQFHQARIAHIRAAAIDDVAGLGRCMAEFDRLGCAHVAAECALAAAASPTVTPTEAKHWLREASTRTGTDIRLARFLADTSLTARERDVAQLAAQGLTSRQISERLGNSRRTVDAHLGRVYAKLGVDGRAGLIERLR